MAADATTPLMLQYQAIKQQVPNALLLFRLGDFYELFFEDAVTAARELEITLTARNKEKGAPVPMCGVPFHSADGYITRLIQRGYRVAICDQMEAAGAGKKLVRREVTRVITPGTATDSQLLRSHENNYLAAVARRGAVAGIAHVDISTGEFRATETAETEVAGLLRTLGAREVLMPAEHRLFGDPDNARGPLVTELEDWIFDADHAGRGLREHFHLLSLDGCGLAGRGAAIGAAGAILHYLRDTQRAALEHLAAPSYYDRSLSLVMDAVTVRNLELVDSIYPEGATLVSVLDQTATGMGGRLLRHRLLHPSTDRAEIDPRLDAVADLHRDVIRRGAVREKLSNILDLERLLAKITLGTAGAREMLALGRSLEQIPLVRAACGDSPPLDSITRRLDEIPELRGQLLDSISDTPPVHLTDGGTIRPGVNAELDELRDLRQNGREHLLRMEARERERTGIQSLKIRFNSVFGYYIEITRANQHLAPANYERKQTLVNAERYTTPEIKDYEVKVLDAEEKILTLEREILEQLRAAATAQAQRIRATAAAVAEVDITAALAQVAAENRYARPQFSEDGEMRILAGRHPVIEKIAEQEAARFIPNDLFLNQTSDLIGIVTGPNMGGKSTYLRQAALMLVLAQMGSFVPADSALLPVTDRIFTRIGAADDLSRGRSTFMVEMTETAVILNTATARSFLILDEIGRGTSTYDGLALAWAVVEYIHHHTRAKSLFATHYHELTILAEELEGVRNLQVAVKEAGDRIVFLRKVEPGAASRSYGIEVARLAGLPMAVIERAREVLKIHERQEAVATAELTPSAGPLQIRLFETTPAELVERIRQAKLDEMRPIDALRFLSELQKEVQ